MLVTITDGRLAHILILTRGLPSLVYSALELSRRLAAAGHRVTFGGDDATRALASSCGLDFLPLDPDGYDDFLRADRRRGWVSRYANARGRRHEARAALRLAGFRERLEHDRPDLVLVNGEMHAHVMAAFGAGVSVALLNTFVSVWRVPGMPPPHHLARPGVGWRGTSAGIALLWENLRLRKMRRRWIARVRDAGCDRLSILRDLAREAGMDAEDLDERQWLIPFTYRRLPVLSLHAREFEFPHRPPEHVHYVGPMILASRADGPLSPADRARLDQLLTAHQASKSRTLIYAGFGSVLSARVPFLRRLVRIVEGRPSWDLVLSLSGRISAAALGPLPPGVHVFPWVPQLDVLAHADVAITHGGINTVDECVTSGVPMLVYPGGETDMGGTTSRVVYHGLGLAGNPRRDGPAGIRRHVDRLLGNPEYRSTVDRFRVTYGAYAEKRVAERTVEALLAARSSRQRERR
jgi:zeaxanthin glucosyltransferase